MQGGDRGTKLAQFGPLAFFGLSQKLSVRHHTSSMWAERTGCLLHELDMGFCVKRLMYKAGYGQVVEAAEARHWYLELESNTTG